MDPSPSDGSSGITWHSSQSGNWREGGRGGVGLENLDLFKCAAHCDKGVVGLSRLFLLGGSTGAGAGGWKNLAKFCFPIQATSPSRAHIQFKLRQQRVPSQAVGAMLTPLCPSLPPPNTWQLAFSRCNLSHSSRPAAQCSAILLVED